VRLISKLLKAVFSWMLVCDSRNLEMAGAIYLPAMGVKKGEGRLVQVGEKGMAIATDLYKKGIAPVIILSNAYLAFWQEEWELKLKLTDAAGIPREAVIPLRPDPTQNFTTSNSETEWLGAVIRERGLKTIIVVNEEWHMMRTLSMLKKRYQEVGFQALNIRNARLEAHKAHPSIKGYTTCEGLWPLENILLALFLRTN